jgi:Ceramidase
MKIKVLLLLLCTFAAVIVAIILKPIPQDLAYHKFADQRIVAGIPNFFNVISNLPFLIVGAYGLKKVKSSIAAPPIKLIYSVLFVGIFLIAFGSAYYHYRPDNSSLVYDRLPMTWVFMAFLSATMATWIDIKVGVWLLLPFLLLGTSSVIYWNYSELMGYGDLRFYAFIQYFPILIIPLIFLLFNNPENNKGLFLLVWVVGWYIAAKLLETFDKNIYTITNVISGHSLKHIAAALATWYMVTFFEAKYVIKHA